MGGRQVDEEIQWKTGEMLGFVAAGAFVHTNSHLEREQIGGNSYESNKRDV